MHTKCDICIDFDTNKSPDIFVSKNAHIMMWWTKNKGVI